MKYTIGMNVLDDWTIMEKLGSGASGTVLEIHKKHGAITQKSALKVISVPQSKDEVQRVLGEGIPMDSVSDYFMEIVKEIKKEIRIMIDLREHPHVVRFEDYAFIPNTDQVGGTILIRMELLYSLNDYLISKKCTEAEICRMARDLGNALDYCHRKKIMHRDIKPENIFVNQVGQFKLGDFGLARTIEKSSGGVSKKGTESYMAPEVFLGKKYDYTVDIYSLGLVMYKCLNKNRLPFFPLDRNFSYAEREEALSRRMMGEVLPKPANAGSLLGNVILKACSFEPSARYQTMSEFVQAINQLINVNKEAQTTVNAQIPSQPKSSSNIASQSENQKKASAIVSEVKQEKETGEKKKKPEKQKESKSVNTEQSPKKKNKMAPLIGVAVLALVGLTNSGLLFNGSNEKNPSETQKNDAVVQDMQSVTSESKPSTAPMEEAGITCYLRQKTSMVDGNSEVILKDIPQYAYVYARNYDENKEWTQVQYIGFTGWIKTAEMVPFGAGNTTLQSGVYCYANTSPGDNSSAVQIHVSPDKNSEVFSEVYYGAEGVIGDIEAGWWNVNVDDQEGWVYLDKFTTYVEDIPYEVIAKSGLKMRSDNDTSASEIGKLPKGTIVTPEEFSYGWAKVTHGGKTGWVAMKHMIPYSEFK